MYFPKPGGKSGLRILLKMQSSSHLPNFTLQAATMSWGVRGEGLAAE